MYLSCKINLTILSTQVNGDLSRRADWFKANTLKLKCKNIMLHDILPQMHRDKHVQQFIR